ncbi:MAG: hypothetical protein JWM98_2327 [Thermoleophilia bacterium]|nr:hypothetical protein [Thermoleophilia bacterium]
MQVAPSAAPRAARPTTDVLASQTIDVRTNAFPGGGATVWTTEREFRLAGARGGIDTFASVTDAIAAARALSAGDMPGLAVMTWRGGYRIHDVHASSTTWVSTSTHAPYPPQTRLTSRSSVPFAAGNLRTDDGTGRNNPAVVRSAALVALIDGARTFVPSTDASWAGRPRLVPA